MPLSNARKLIVGVTAGMALVAATAGITYSATTGSTITKQAAVIRTFPTTTTVGVPAAEVPKLTAYTGPSTISTCGTVIDHKIITGGIDVRATNGKATAYTSEAAAKADACVTFTNDKFLVGGGTAQAITTRWATDTTCKLNGTARPCGPVYIADTSVLETAAPTGIVNLLVETNFHAWRTYVTGGDQAINCDSYCDVHDSYLEASRLDTTGNAHMDAFSDNGGNTIILDHNTLYCHVTNGASVPNGSGGCSGDLGFFGDFNQIDNITVNNNLFIASGDPAYCVYTGASGNTAKAFPRATNLRYTNNVWQRGPNSKCATYGPVADWTTGPTLTSCNNIWEDGTTVLADSANCGSLPTTTTTQAPVTTLPPTTIPPPPPTSTTVVGPTTTTTKPVSTTTTTKPVVTTTTTVPVTPTTECLKSTTPKVCTVLP